MKKLLTLVAAVTVVSGSFGCNWCGRRPLLNWWNGGDSCHTCATVDSGCADGNCHDSTPGVLGTPIYNNVPFAPRGSNFENLPAPSGS